MIRLKYFKSSLYFLILLTVCFINSFMLKGQEEDEIVIKYPEQYLFPDFQPGKVAMKTGKDIYLLLNYSVVLEKMMFLQRGQVYEMVNCESVDTIYLQGKKFIPWNKIFLEVAIEDKIPLFIQHTGKDLGASKPAAYDGKSDVSSSNYMNYMPLKGEPFRMKNIDETNIKYDDIYWIIIDGQMKSFVSKNQLLKHFPDKKNQIKKYIADNKVDFEVSDDVVKLIEFCNKLF